MNRFSLLSGALLLLTAASAHAQTLPSGVGVWLKPDSLSAGALSSWTDASGNSRNATQATTTKQPTVVSSALNGCPVVRFDGTDDYMVFPAVAMPNAQIDAFIVVKAQSATPSADKGLWFLGNGDGNCSTYPNTTGQIYDCVGSYNGRNTGAATRPVTVTNSGQPRDSSANEIGRPVVYARLNRRGRRVSQRVSSACVCDLRGAEEFARMRAVNAGTAGILLSHTESQRTQSSLCPL